MKNISLKTFVPKEFDTNCYVLYSKDECVIIDPSFVVEDVQKWIDEKKLKILGIILTHAHYDHIGYSFKMARDNDIKVYVYKKEEQILLRDHLASLFRLTPDIDLKFVEWFEGTSLTIGQFSFDIIHCPGHTAGGISLKINEWLFTGDTLFYDSIGRSDLPTGSIRQLKTSIDTICDNFSNSTMIYPGHGKSGKLGEIKKANFFLKNKK